MEQAIKKTQEYKNDSIQDRSMDGLKPAINNLLHVYLPNDITIKDADILAMVINEMIWNPQQFLNPKNE